VPKRQKSARLMVDAAVGRWGTWVAEKAAKRRQGGTKKQPQWFPVWSSEELLGDDKEETPEASDLATGGDEWAAFLEEQGGSF
jgi:hypothetical protein